MSCPSSTIFVPKRTIDAVIAGSSLVRLMVPETAKEIFALWPVFASTIAARSVPDPLSARLVTSISIAYP